MTRPHVHVITPGDHFSPRTGSAVPTVVHGLATGRPADQDPPAVVVARGTYQDRYQSARIVEYDQRTGRRFDRHIDAALSRGGLPRLLARRSFAATVVEQSAWAPSVILGHNAVQLIPSVDARRHLPVLYAHNHLLRTYSRRECERTLASVARIICVSRFLADQMAPHLPEKLQAKLTVVHNGVDTSFFTPDPGRRRDDHIEVVFIGRVLPEKGPDVLIEAVRRLGRADVHLTIVGAIGFDPHSRLTEFERSLRQQAAQTPTVVTFRPFLPRSDIAAVLRASDVAVVPSRWAEPFALTVLEGMASGAAVIGSRIGGVPEAMGNAGILVPPDDPDALAGAIEALATDEAALDRMRRSCRRRAEEQDWSRVHRQLQSALEEAIP